MLVGEAQALGPVWVCVCRWAAPGLLGCTYTRAMLRLHPLLLAVAASSRWDHRIIAGTCCWRALPTTALATIAATACKACRSHLCQTYVEASHLNACMLFAPLSVGICLVQACVVA